MRTHVRQYAFRMGHILHVVELTFHGIKSKSLNYRGRTIIGVVRVIDLRKMPLAFAQIEKKHSEENESAVQVKLTPYHRSVNGYVPNIPVR